jgi:hypothetical protein
MAEGHGQRTASPSTASHALTLGVPGTTATLTSGLVWPCSLNTAFSTNGFHTSANRSKPAVMKKRYSSWIDHVVGKFDRGQGE